MDSPRRAENLRRMPTQAKVAARAGVSQEAVSHILGGKRAHLFSEQTRELVRKAAKSLGYQPNRAAQVMRRGRTNLILHLNCGGYTELAGLRSYHIGRLTHEAGFDYQTVDSFWWPEEGEQIINRILSARPEGVIVSGSFQVKTDFTPVLAAAIPVVGVEAKIPGCLCTYHDARGAFAEITRRCLEQNRNPALLLREHLTFSPQARRLGFLDALAEVGINKTPEAKLRTAPAGKTPRHPVIWLHELGIQEFEPFESGMDAARLFLEKDCLPDALICTNDHYAIGVMTMLLQAGVRIPDDIAVSGYDNVTYSRQGIVPLTTVEQPIAAMCGEAIDFLTKQIRNPSRPEKPDMESLHPCRIHWRQSMPWETDACSAGFSTNGHFIAMP